MALHEEWRALLYPIGFIASLFFSLRFLVQWIISEKHKKSIVPPIFWKLSLIGNLFLCLHAFLQVQYPFCCIQACNALISWRNLNLMKPKEKQSSFYVVLGLLVGSLCLISLLFMIEGYYLYGYVDWIRTPTLPWTTEAGKPLPLIWHVIGTFGAFLFSFRFWVQWIESERVAQSVLSKSFWSYSLIGAAIALAYFIKTNDIVNILGYSMAIIPALRNLMLISKNAVKS